MVYKEIIERIEKGEKMFAMLIDPDKQPKENQLKELLEMAEKAGVDFIFAGGSLISRPIDESISLLKQYSDLPVVLFPGSLWQISEKADALLFLSLISGRNPDFLIGNQVVAAPILRKTNLEIISTGYVLVDCGSRTSVEYMSNTNPIPYTKNDIAVATALAGEMLGFKAIYMDGGSGAEKPISTEMISAVRKSTKIPLIIGGGICNSEQAQNALNAGADIIVIGNAIEKNPNLLRDLNLKTNL